MIRRKGLLKMQPFLFYVLIYFMIHNLLLITRLIAYMVVVNLNNGMEPYSGVITVVY